jgi:hypothetical protein
MNNKIITGGLLVLAVTLAMDLMDHGHAGHGFLSIPGFEFALGLVCALILAVLAKIVMYNLIGRKIDYYEVEEE